ncbi:MAG: hypothetical protein IJ091_09745 [Oscillospiraceae bacterium]|nr:hypothetical protein [Oscillospiraceae bacterium]
MEKKTKEKSKPVFRLANLDEEEKVIQFINDNFDWKLPLINRPEYFEYYYKTDGLQFALAEIDGEYAAACGYILCNTGKERDVWASVFVARKDCSGVGIRLVSELGKLANAKSVSCNNIRENTLNLYRFLGWTAERIPHYYRIAKRDDLEDFHLCRPMTLDRLPVSGELKLRKVSEDEVEQISFPKTDTVPQKDLWYLKRRYFHFPHQSYDVWSVSDGESSPAYLVTRTVLSGENCDIPVVRIVDYIGPADLLPQLGNALDELLHASNAEYLDCYNVGIPAEIWEKAGLTERKRDSGTVIPNYLTPPLYENTEYFYFTNSSDRFVLFKADGDQDRPNLT